MMAEVLRSLGGETRTGHRVRSIDDLPESRAVLFALSPRQIEVDGAIESGQVAPLLPGSTGLG